MSNNVVINKLETISRCLSRIEEEFQNDKQRFLNSYTVQDSIILNIQRACEASIDLAMHLISSQKLGVPQATRDAFKILEDKDIIDAQLSSNLQAMVGFRNIAVHDYQKLQEEIVISIIEKRLIDFEDFSEVMKKFI